MVDREVKDVWALYLFNWVPLLLLALLLVICLVLTDFSLKIESLLPAVGIILLIAVAGHALSRAGYLQPAFALVSIAQLQLLVLLATLLTYIAASANLPMQDANLAFVDRLIGLDWQAYYKFVYVRPVLVPYIYFGYAMITWPAFSVPIFLGATRNYRRLQQFTFACTLTLVVTAIISSLLPAFGTYYQYGISADTPIFRASGYLAQLHELPLIRDGSLRVLNLEDLVGIITFPSFHAAAAILTVWALWSMRWMRPLVLPANVGMLLATPLVGGHYFIDVFAGAALAVLAIAAARRIGENSSVATSVMTQEAVTA
jgi:hypothetical protein